jgi:hypothetical protein
LGAAGLRHIYAESDAIDALESWIESEGDECYAGSLAPKLEILRGNTVAMDAFIASGIWDGSAFEGVDVQCLIPWWHAVRDHMHAPDPSDDPVPAPAADAGADVPPKVTEPVAILNVQAPIPVVEPSAAAVMPRSQVSARKELPPGVRTLESILARESKNASEPVAGRNAKPSTNRFRTDRPRTGNEDRNLEGEIPHHRRSKLKHLRTKFRKEALIGLYDQMRTSRTQPDG